MLQQRQTDQITWLIFDRPQRLNSFTVADYRDFRVAIERALQDEMTRCIVVTGNGRAFSAGADRSLLDPAAAAADRDRAGEEFARFLQVLQDCDKPVLAAVNGLAVGIGCTMLMYFDLVLAVESARFRLPFTALGMVPEAGSSVLLPARARWDHTMWAMISSEWIDAELAQEMGIVWRVVPDGSLLDVASNVAATIAVLDPASVAATKRLLTAGRATVARQAVERELAEMRHLVERRQQPPTRP
jgi:enoyl-CoA hydratase/carnithine racemase